MLLATLSTDFLLQREQGFEGPCDVLIFCPRLAGVLGPSGRQWVRQEVQVQEVAAALPVSGDAPQTDPFDDDEDFEVELDDQGPYGAAAGDEMPATNTYQEVRAKDSGRHLEHPSTFFWHPVR